MQEISTFVILDDTSTDRQTRRLHIFKSFCIYLAQYTNNSSIFRPNDLWSPNPHIVRLGCLWKNLPVLYQLSTKPIVLAFLNLFSVKIEFEWTALSLKDLIMFWCKIGRCKVVNHLIAACGKWMKSSFTLADRSVSQNKITVREIDWTKHSCVQFDVQSSASVLITPWTNSLIVYLIFKSWMCVDFFCTQCT